MKTILEHLETLPEPYRTQAIENYDNQIVKPIEASDALPLAFVWAYTKQGFNYWQNVQDNIITKGD